MPPPHAPDVPWHARPSAPAPGTALCRLAEVPDGGREVVFGTGAGAFRMFVVRRGTAIWGYLNLCPHFRLPLNLQPDAFLTRAGDRILCRMHYATFRIEDGACLSGPCEGAALQAVPVELRDGVLRIAAPAAA